jgi:hypothetical protein
MSIPSIFSGADALTRSTIISEIGGITGCGALFRVPSVLDKMPKDLFPSHVAATNYARDRQHDWNVVPPPPAPIKVDVTINLKSRPSETS